MKSGKILLSVYPTYSAGNTRPGREFFISRLCETLGWTRGAEIGVRTGRTLFHLLRNFKDLHMVAVDKDCAQFWTMDAQDKYHSRVQVLQGLSWEMAQHVPDGSLDFYFIDAGHGFKSVVRDIDAWTPKIRSGGWMLGHDINFPAVNSAVRDRFDHFEVGSDNVWFHNPTRDYTMLRRL